ncbi:hypothetical protein [Rhodocaloribacter sp.]
MERELNRLARLLREIVADAGYAMVYCPEPETVAFCRRQYERIARRLRMLDPSFARLPVLPEDASPGAVRVLAREAAFRVERTLRRMRRRSRSEADCLLTFFHRLFDFG